MHFGIILFLEKIAWTTTTGTQNNVWRRYRPGTERAGNVAAEDSRRR